MSVLISCLLGDGFVNTIASSAALQYHCATTCQTAAGLLLYLFLAWCLKSE